MDLNAVKVKWINFILKLFDILNIKFFNINLTGQSYSCTYPTTLFLHKSSFYCQPNAVILVIFFSSIYFLIHILILKSAFPDPHTLIIIPSSSIPHLRNLILEPSFSNTHPLILFLRFTYLNFSLSAYPHYPSFNILLSYLDPHHRTVIFFYISSYPNHPSILFLLTSSSYTNPHTLIPLLS